MVKDVDIAVLPENKLYVAEQVVSVLREAQNLKELAEKAEKQAKKVHEQIKNAMESHGIKCADIQISDDEYLHITYVEPTTRSKKNVNFDLLKEDGLYGRYVEEAETNVRASLRITKKEIENE